MEHFQYTTVQNKRIVRKMFKMLLFITLNNCRNLGMQFFGCSMIPIFTYAIYLLAVRWTIFKLYKSLKLLKWKTCVL